MRAPGFVKRSINRCGEIIARNPTQIGRSSRRLYGSPLGREIAPKWTSLFNGTDLTGWTVYPEIEKKNKKPKKKDENLEENEKPSQDPLDDWRVEEGVLIGKGRRRALLSEQKCPETLPASQDRRRNDFVGHIALQSWEPETELRFREIKIMELPKLPKDHRLTRSDAAWMTQLAYNIQFLIDEKKKIFEADKARFRQEKISFQKLIQTECDLIDTQIQWAIAKYQSADRTRRFARKRIGPGFQESRSRPGT